ncbi:MAG TPA: ParB N-terminal domain-containing protein [Sphingomicrobium sp.]|nr:ParB N-terminal domain-containing protein [Sphingomicrobium sp.]
MELKHIDIANLTVSAANMRGKAKVDIANILPSVRARGILVPLMVRPKPCPEPVEGGSPDTFEIVAGKRRYHAALAVAEENGGECDPLPCAVLDDADDAAALEASLIENVARLDPDEVTRWESFTHLMKEGRSPEDIALTFGLTELQVKRTLALGNLLPRIRHLYRDEKIDAVTVKHLTLASKAQQKEWLALLDDPQAWAPTGSQLKAWLFGGASIPTSAAMFDLSTYEGELVTDLFGEDSYFASAEAFWAAQNAAIEAKAASYREAGWSEVIVLEPGSYFNTWEHERRSKKNRGKVFIAVSHRGDVTIHEGYVSRREARRQEQAEAGEKPKRPEVTASMQNYIDLHRHAVVRARLVSKPMLALRVLLAHAIVGSNLLSVRVEPQRAMTDAIAESVETNPSEAVFDLYRRDILNRLGFDPETPTVVHGYDGETGVSGLLAQLLGCPDETILDALVIVMGEALEAATPFIEVLGRQLEIDMADSFAVDGALLDLIKDREVLDAMLGEVGGQQIAEANANATGKVKRQIIADCLNGTNGRAKIERFVPRWMIFPPSAYTTRGGVQTVTRAAAIECLFAPATDAVSPLNGTDEPTGASEVAVEPQPVAEAA